MYTAKNEKKTLRKYFNNRKTFSAALGHFQEI